MIGYRMEYELIPDPVKDALSELRHAMENHTDWSGMQVTMTYPGHTTVDVQVRED